MIIGSGLLARSFAPYAGDLSNVCIYAAGVSNSSCTDQREFFREYERLTTALQGVEPGTLFVYLSTCSIGDPEANSMPYVRHKLAMEEVARRHQQHLVLRLPQLAGSTPNPHTLLNYLYARIARSERFQVWGGAKRNIIDVDDVVLIARALLLNEHATGETVNVASPQCHTMFEIIKAMELVLGTPALFDTVARGNAYTIDTRRIANAVKHSGVCFPDTYLQRVIRKYYGHDV
ncbi:MAG: NAD-dependent epimerase/dehydratase family protein [Proteobacteria bacterium]|nr:NAD-dependent epimerase/dehydratase family protein [Pseudomonadota bacterium]